MDNKTNGKTVGGGHTDRQKEKFPAFITKIRVGHRHSKMTSHTSSYFFKNKYAQNGNGSSYNGVKP
jgi:hypothetical protein